MKVAIRADASPRIGGGHVMRCLTLASALVRLGGEVVFLCQAGARQTVPALDRAGYPVIDVSANPDETVAKIKDLWPAGAHALVADSYAISDAEECVLRSAAHKLVVIDDLADRAHDCDVLLDQTFGRCAQDYAGLVPTNTTVLTGARYALLRPEFADRRDEALDRRRAGSPVRRVLVSLGLSDVSAVTQRIVSATLNALNSASIDVVIGASANAEQLQRLADRQPRVRLHVDPPSMIDLMVDADLAIGAAGATSWERCCVGLPTLIAVLADNQRKIASELTQAGAALSFELDNDLEVTLRDQLVDLAASTERRREIGLRAARIIDGAGAQRVAEVIAAACREGGKGVPLPVTGGPS